MHVLQLNFETKLSKLLMVSRKNAFVLKNIGGNAIHHKLYRCFWLQDTNKTSHVHDFCTLSKNIKICIRRSTSLTVAFPTIACTWLVLITITLYSCGFKGKDTFYREKYILKNRSGFTPQLHMLGSALVYF